MAHRRAGTTFPTTPFSDGLTVPHLPVFKSHAGTRICVKVITGTRTSNDGYLVVHVDEGQGLRPATAVGKDYSGGQPVLAKCFDSLTAIAVQNTNTSTDAWTGSVLFSRETDGLYTPGQCTGCTTTGRTASIVVDSDSDSGDQAPTRCLHGELCAISPGEHLRVKDT